MTSLARKQAFVHMPLWEVCRKVCHVFRADAKLGGIKTSRFCDLLGLRVIVVDRQL